MSHRVADYPINNLILNRWSPRAMSAEKVTHEELMSLFEAARWAPSSYNNQPWAFVYVTQTDTAFSDWLDTLVPFNKEWAQHASALIAVLSKNNFHFNNKPSRTHAFDTGAAWQNIALQGNTMNLVIHGMEGFSYEKIAHIIQMPDGYTLHMLFAVGKSGKKELLSPEMQKQEAPNDRKKIETFVFTNSFKK